LILQSNRLANTVRRYIRIHDFYHIKTYMFKQNHSSSGRPMNAPTVWFVQTIFTNWLSRHSAEKTTLI